MGATFLLNKSYKSYRTYNRAMLHERTAEVLGRRNDDSVKILFGQAFFRKIGPFCVFVTF